MKVPYRQLQPGRYRLARSVRIHGETLICDYPLRVLRPGPTTLRLIVSCSEERNCSELAALLKLPLKRVETLCEQLYWKGLLDAGPTITPETWPGVSIIIPTHNRARQLERCFTALLNLNYPPDCMEIIVVDDASSDRTSVLLKRLEGECDAKKIPLHVVRHTRQKGVAISRNSGAELARMEVLAFIDSDCVATPDWLKDLTPVFEDEHIGAVGGMIRAHKRRSTLGRYEDVCSSLFMGVRPQQVKLEGPLTYLPTANFLVRREAWEKVDGFAPLTFGEDVDFCRRLLLSGSAIRYEPRGIVLHDYRTTLSGFVKTRVSYASAEAALLKRHPTERRVLVLPAEQGAFAALAIGGLMGMLPFSLATIFALFGARKRLAALRRQRVSLNPLVVVRATLRGHLAYVYHLCRHLTRYYTLPALLVGMIFPPLLLLAFMLCSIVIGVDYARLRPRMTIGSFALCSLLDDCAYEIGVLLGCIKQRTWKPLIPVIRRSAIKM